MCYIVFETTFSWGNKGNIYSMGYYMKHIKLYLKCLGQCMKHNECSVNCRFWLVLFSLLLLKSEFIKVAMSISKSDVQFILGSLRNLLSLTEFFLNLILSVSGIPYIG